MRDEATAKAKVPRYLPEFYLVRYICTYCTVYLCIKVGTE